jgi:hypothetical protein
LAALLARTEDELGTIVVGMSLALASVGVGAWTYDTVRRYRAAMDMVTTQEQAVLARLSAPHDAAVVPPARDASVVSHDERTDRPLSEMDDEFQSEIEPDTETVLVDESPESLPNSGYDKDESPEDVVAPSSRETSEASAEHAEMLTDDAEPEVKARNPVLPESDQAMADRPVPISQPERSDEAHERLTNGEPGRGDAASEPKAVIRWPSITRSAPAERVELAARDEFAELPPLPEEQQDTLLGESVRLDKRPGAGNHVPSWLFDDLETDLTRPGSVRQDDPIDRFGESEPRKRSSALDRILAGEPTSRLENGDDVSRKESPASRTSDPSDGEED